MKEFLIEGSPNGTVIMGEYVQAPTEADARTAWRAAHPGWQLERVLEVKLGCNWKGDPRRTRERWQGIALGLLLGSVVILLLFAMMLSVRWALDGTIRLGW